MDKLRNSKCTVAKCLCDNGFQRNVQSAVLVDGSTRTLLMQETIKIVFGENEPKQFHQISLCRFQRIKGGSHRARNVWASATWQILHLH